ncbi:MAG TPA: DNA gyrase modulator, partial [Candidatus Acidoferrales bacterium]|nr:DNA gyrase modulator [Candidatus Acidoferrales bacterium]
MSVRAFFATQHGVDDIRLEQTIAEALGRGGDFADVYVEHRQHTSLQLEERLLKESSEAVALGAGVRVVLGEQTGYAYTNELSLERLLEAARTAAAIARGEARGTRISLSSKSLPSRYPAEQSAQ